MSGKIDFGRLADDFAPREARSEREIKAGVSPSERWPSREPQDQSRERLPEGQLSIKGPLHILERFKRLCKDDRRSYYDMLEILMNEYEHKGV